jgi:DNA-binding transcriptional LysR family regulator
VIPLEPHFSTNENEGAIATAVAGFGITSTSGWACSRELEDGSLIRLFLGWKMVGIPCTPIFPWVQRRAPPGGRPSIIWLPTSGVGQTSFRRDRTHSDRLFRRTS